MAVKHSKVSAIPDGGDSTLVEPSDWNANHTIDAGTITDTHVAAANKDGAAGTASMRTLGTGATQAVAGNDPRLNINVKSLGALGDSTTDDTAAIQAAINLTDANRGGTVFFPQGRYRIATGLTVNHQGTELVGEGRPGTSRGQASGSSRIISDNGITAITFSTGSHATLGFGMRRLHVIAASGATTGNGVLVSDAESFRAEDVTVSDYIGGYGMRLDGGSSNAQYAQLVNFSAGDSLTGLDLRGTAPNGLRMFGGYFAGQGTTPRVGSIAINIETGDTMRFFGVVIQGWETGIYLQSAAAGHEFHGPRLEYCNICLRFGASAQKSSLIGGTFVNSLLVNTGAGNIGIKVDSGASAIVLTPTTIVGTVTPISDSGTATKLVLGTTQHADTTGITATDHHAAPAAGPDADITVDVAGAAGTASTFARSGHGHKVATSSGTPAAVGTAAAGTSGHSPSRDDHVHATGAGTPSTQAMGDAAATGSGPAAAMTDHKHAMPALGTTTAAVGTSAGGSATTPSKSDHVHATGAGTPSTQALGDAAATGSGPAAAMTDHKHAMPAAAVTTSGLTQATAKILGRTTAATGAIEEITVGSGLTLSAGSITATGGSGSVATDTIWDTKGDIAAATGADAAAKLPAGADDTILMADAAQTTGLKWVASGTPSTQAFGDSATVGTADTFTRGDHKHAWPVLGTTAAAIGTSAGGSATTPSKSDHVHAQTVTTSTATADTSMVTAGTFYDPGTGGTLTPAAGSYIIFASAFLTAGTSAIRQWSGKIWDGTTTFVRAEFEVTGTGAAGQACLTAMCYQTLTGSQTIKMSCTSTVNGDTYKGNAVTGSYIVAIRVA